MEFKIELNWVVAILIDLNKLLDLAVLSVDRMNSLIVLIK